MAVNWGPPDADRVRGVVLASPGESTLLELAFPTLELSQIVHADRRAADPLYSIHRWWARRPPALLRGLLLAAVLPSSTRPTAYWDLFSSDELPLSGLSVHDPFAGGGSTLVEAARLGARVSGSDVDPLAVDIVRHELAPTPQDEVRDAGGRLLAYLTDSLGTLYPGSDGAVPLHYFWLHQVTCGACDTAGQLYRNLVLARDSGKAGAVVRDEALTVFCPVHLQVHHLKSPTRKRLVCGDRRYEIAGGTFKGGRYVCPQCSQVSTHRELQTGVAPRVLVAVEETNPNSRRRLRSAGDRDLAGVSDAQRYLVSHRERLDLPTGMLSQDRRDPRPLTFGMKAALDLFDDRPAVVLGSALRWVRDEDLRPGVRRALTLAISNALATNNKLCSYATEYGRLSALFSVRGYSLPSLPVELNPLHPDGGRGTIRACIERVARAAQPTVRRYVWSGERAEPVPCDLKSAPDANPEDVRCGSASEGLVDSASGIDVCVFDPPYFDYIAYSELSEFYRSWFPGADLTGDPLLPQGDNGSEHFGLALAECLRPTVGRLAEGRLLAFTYHSADAHAWSALGVALDDAKLAVTALWPIRSDGHMGHHSHPGNCEWDIVVVCRRARETTPAPLRHTVDAWIKHVEPLAVGDADRASMALALQTAAPRFAVLPSTNAGVVSEP